jgi:hypothetical protein
MSYGEQVWAWVERLTWIIVIFGIPLFFVEQYLHVRRERASATLDYMKKFQDAHLVSQRFILLAPWMQYDLQTLSNAKPSTRAMDDLVLGLIEKSQGTGRDMREAISTSSISTTRWYFVSAPAAAMQNSPRRIFTTTQGNFTVSTDLTFVA